MSEKYRGAVDDRVYAGEAVDISFSGKRCIVSMPKNV